MAPDYDKMRKQLAEAFGPNFTVEKFWYDCDASVTTPKPMVGSVTICLRKRIWCPGSSAHGVSTIGDGKWFGVRHDDPDKYKGRGWVAKMAEDIKVSLAKGVEDLIENHPNWMYGMSPEEARAAVR